MFHSKYSFKATDKYTLTMGWAGRICSVINAVGNNIILVGNKKGRYICCIYLKLTPEQLFVNFDYIQDNNLVLHH